MDRSGLLRALGTRLDRALARCGQVFLALANGCLAVLLIINVMNIASRGIWDRGLQWVFPWSTVLFVWMTFFGFFVLYRRRADITVDFIYDRLGPSGQVLVRQGVNLIVLTLMAVMIWHGPELLERQAGIIEQVYFLGIQVERFTLAVPLFITCILIFADYTLDLLFTLRGEVLPSLQRSEARPDARS